MTTLERRLQDQGYKGWVKTGLCFSILKHGLEGFVDERSKRIHRQITYQLRNNPSSVSVCRNARIIIDRRTKKWIFNCCQNCQSYIDEIEKMRAPYFVFNRNNWENSDVNLWPAEHWEIAKCFMNPGQKRIQKCPGDCDVSGLLNFIDHCSILRNDIAHGQNISKVRLC